MLLRWRESRIFTAKKVRMKNYLISLVQQALGKITSETALPEVTIEKPRSPEHGDAATNIAMLLAKQLRNNPRAIAQQIVDNLEYDSNYISGVEIAGPGFINFRIAPGLLHQQLETIRQVGADFGKTAAYSDSKIQVEFVSANPTGPLTVGHGRNAVLGDTVARLFEWCGAEVDREYYFNNAGRQMRVLGESVRARYLELVGDKPEWPEGGYEGEYIKNVAEDLKNKHGESLRDQKDVTPFKEAAEEAIFRDIQQTLKRMHIEMDQYFNEYSVYKSGDVDRVVKQLREKNLAYDQDEAVWFKTTEFGKDKDTVLVKNTGEPTYRLPDIAYHQDKLDRGYDLCIDVLGADHIDTFPDVLSGLEALGYDKNKVEALVYQFVTLTKDGKPYKMSTRKANFVTLDELMDEVGEDVTRFFFLMRSPNTHLEFDIGEAKEAGEKNPVYYLQYAHARIHSIKRKFKDTEASSAEIDFNLLTHDSELKLIKTLIDLPEVVVLATENREPHRLINYLNEVAASFHKFYHDCRIIGEDNNLAASRMALLETVALVMNNGLTILGISAPEKM